MEYQIGARIALQTEGGNINYSDETFVGAILLSPGKPEIVCRGQGGSYLLELTEWTPRRGLVEAPPALRTQASGAEAPAAPPAFKENLRLHLTCRRGEEIVGECSMTTATPSIHFTAPLPPRANRKEEVAPIFFSLKGDLKRQAAGGFEMRHEFAVRQPVADEAGRIRFGNKQIEGTLSLLPGKAVVLTETGGTTYSLVLETGKPG